MNKAEKTKNTNAERIKKLTAATGLGLTLLSGVGALYAGHEANRATSVEQSYAAQGNQQQAAEWSANAEGYQHDAKLLISLGLTALAGTAVTEVSLNADRRRDQEALAQPAQPSPEA